MADCIEPNREVRSFRHSHSPSSLPNLSQSAQRRRPPAWSARGHRSVGLRNSAPAHPICLPHFDAHTLSDAHLTLQVQEAIAAIVEVEETEGEQSTAPGLDGVLREELRADLAELRADSALTDKI
eukprot:3544187-Pleurochrysis_carterae.AAC.1